MIIVILAITILMMIIIKLFTYNCYLKDNIKNIEKNNKKEKKYICKECGEELKISIDKESNNILVFNCENCGCEFREVFEYSYTEYD